MTEDDAKAWLRSTIGVSRETMSDLETYRELVIRENEHQNLISERSIAHFWARHIVDAAQLSQLVASDAEGDHVSRWLDLGSGAGLPGLVIAILRNDPILLVEARRRRAEFLVQCADALNLPHVEVKACMVEALPTKQFDAITARAFAPLARLLSIAHRFSTEKTLWLLPKGRSAQSELESIKNPWHGVFHVKQSVTDSEAGIIVATGVRPADAS